jgi:hypothetical protein
VWTPRRSVGIDYDNSHELGIVALILANLSTQFEGRQVSATVATPFMARILQDRAVMEKLFRLAVHSIVWLVFCFIQSSLKKLWIVFG